MTAKTIRYGTILFDWGDTVMRDEPANMAPMVEWEIVEVIDGIPNVLTYLQSSGRCIVLATSADISDENQIRRALARGNLEQYFSHIYCFKNTKLPKGEAFYRHILNDLNASASDAFMVGDSFEKDVQIPNSLGMFAVWFNPRTEENRQNQFHATVHSLGELQEFFQLWDQK